MKLHLIAYVHAKKHLIFICCWGLFMLHTPKIQAQIKNWAVLLQTLIMHSLFFSTRLSVIVPCKNNLGLLPPICAESLPWIMLHLEWINNKGHFNTVQMNTQGQFSWGNAIRGYIILIIDIIISPIGTLGIAEPVSHQDKTQSHRQRWSGADAKTRFNCQTR